MVTLGAIGFLTPWLLLGLLLLPVLWLLLRAIPPSPLHLKFPGVRLLLGLRDPEKMPERTPWWLLLIRLLALAAVIIAFAEPVLNPTQEVDNQDGPLLVVMDGGWASAPDWEERLELAEAQIDKASAAGRPTMFVSLAEPLPGDGGYNLKEAEDWLPEIRALEPAAWPPDRAGFAEWLAAQTELADTVWITDGVGYEDDTLYAALAAKGDVQVLGTESQPLGLWPIQIINGEIVLTVIGPPADLDRDIEINILGTAPNGLETVLQRVEGVLPAGESQLELTTVLPLELRNRMTRVALANQRTAGAVALADDGLKRRKVGIVVTGDSPGPRLVSGEHYLLQALTVSAEVIEGELNDLLLSSPDAIILPDVGNLSVQSTEKLINWVEEGGLLLRFAGPNLAVSGAGQLTEDPLLPVRLRAGGRDLGGAMSWASPKRLEPFDENSPFFGLTVPDEVTITSQIIAQPGPELGDRTIASLEDGTPLVTRKALGQGQVVLFHVTASPGWSTLPLSGLFVQMLERLSVNSGFGGETIALEGRLWEPDRLLSGWGELQDVDGLVPVEGSLLAADRASAAAAPGIYTSAETTAAVNVLRIGDALGPLDLPAGVVIQVATQQAERFLKPWFLLAGLALLLLDILASLWVGGRLQNFNLARGAAGIGVALMLTGLPTDRANAQVEERWAMEASLDTVLAYVITGDREVDAASEAGLFGLSVVLTERTSIEPGQPIGVDLERDELAFFPLLYWPITDTQSNLSEQAVLKLNRYLATGGMILFDTRDAHLGSGFGSVSGNGQVLQRLTARLDIPPLVPVEDGHVLTRAFYLLDDFPGRWVGPPIWAQVSNVQEVEGLFISSPNDGVTPVVIGANDWAAAWAMDDRLQPLYPVGRGLAGNRQREMAYRFGVNLIMYVMTGNYKSDQVHVPALLERLGE